ncbi:glyoxalase superfamily protein [Pontivivens insulae]|uniref:Bleomycin resistance protein n=1 Tax=Pontivivens insulae TaxID=1639689 RepID=A0A2R8A7Q0_9RHOB|nr:glyoxalase superfamily protein [Pontivivens insulae]RED18161.1 putative glyoxalase superfamily protein PhnB [Pontivivens insulae]SPF28058.1 hypothetical protein POI8812_00356 [Pontivivens insulae]
MRVGTPVPIFRSFDESKAREFWIDFLGFEVQWQHRFEADAPLYMELRRRDCVLHISEHHGDATPGGRVRVEVEDIEALHAELTAKNYRNARPGINDTSYGAREVSVTDPFGNGIVFWAPLSDQS